MIAEEIFFFKAVLIYCVTIQLLVMIYNWNQIRKGKDLEDIMIPFSAAVGFLAGGMVFAVLDTYYFSSLLSSNFYTGFFIMMLFVVGFWLISELIFRFHIKIMAPEKVHSISWLSDIFIRSRKIEAD